MRLLFTLAIILLAGAEPALSDQRDPIVVDITISPQCGLDRDLVLLGIRERFHEHEVREWLSPNNRREPRFSWMRIRAEQFGQFCIASVFTAAGRGGGSEIAFYGAYIDMYEIPRSSEPDLIELAGDQLELSISLNHSIPD